MQVRLLKGNGKSEEATCRHIEVTEMEAGIEVHLIPGSTWRLPQDGTDIYVMSDQARVTNHFQWPPKKKESGNG